MHLYIMHMPLSLTPLARCAVKGDQVRAELCRAALQQIFAPETPDV